MAQWNPLHDLVSLQDRMNRLFEDASQRRADERGCHAGSPIGAQEAAPSEEVEGADWYPAADVYETNVEYTVAVDLPGIDRATLDISVDDNRLTIKGTRVSQDSTQHRGECPRGNFLRTFSVPAAIDQNDIRADYKDGVLQVHLPKRPEPKAERVEIKIS
ncbi:MAG TPA: Hsp20/alpha crystallin family protein [Pyrinomonadaceae bacterium]|jgi:HSP20 family protein|nr:Hsp20/alpha crystallin family protein [Pyrinomonadaceae bacterium]